MLTGVHEAVDPAGALGELGMQKITVESALAVKGNRVIRTKNTYFIGATSLPNHDVIYKNGPRGTAANL